MEKGQFITIDIGSAWTKLFLVEVDSENLVNIKKTLRLPTSRADLSLSVNSLLAEVSESGPPKIFVSSLEEAREVAKEKGGELINEKDAKKELADFFKKSDSDSFVFDAGATSLSRNTDIEEVGKFLTFSTNDIALENFFGNKRVRVHILPGDTKELEIDEAVLRGSFTEHIRGRAKENKLLIIASGGLISGTPNLSRVAILVSDILEKGDVAQVFFDREFFLPSFGAMLSKYKQLRVANVGPWLEALGAFVSLGGQGAVTLDWGYAEAQEVELGVGEISLVPVPKEQKIYLSFTLDKKNKRNFTVFGGSLGILIDAREKPLELSFGKEASRKKVISRQRELEKAAASEEAF